jgi:hypothetical protein
LFNFSAASGSIWGSEARCGEERDDDVAAIKWQRYAIDRKDDWLGRWESFLQLDKKRSRISGFLSLESSRSLFRMNSAHGSGCALLLICTLVLWLLVP